ncbi:response regulator [Streptococcus gallolyticus]|uniref:response regulator transcription factor n=1 Tax=Streptococcus hepaticus TaxID=3349163 RepID=UPI001C9884C4|nr:response regulator [Streptococcus gallolyticus]MBY5041758.1 response regulator [Streptococcus gallolyticus]
MYSILIVEDEYLVRQGICSLIDFEKFQIEKVAEAEDGRKAWELFQAQPFDIVLTDINMPKMNGIQLAQLIKEEQPNCHLVFLTGYDEFDYALSALKLGADDYLLKPFSKADVEEILTKIQTKLAQDTKIEQLEEYLVQGEVSDLQEQIRSQLSNCDFSLKQLADQLGFSPNYLSVLIKKDVGLNFQDYLNQERMKQAKYLLLTTDLKIYEIAEKVGFWDMNYFSQRFKQTVGVTPRQFRKGETR